MKLATAAALTALAAAPASADPLDDLFSPFAKPNSPGCAVGVAQKGQPPVFRAWGQADLEHPAPISPETVFEAGSVSKQFTAAAVLLLVQDGKLKLTDDIRKYLPEMPSYGAPITIDHLLTHTSGLRDWGEVAALAGWPRGTRAYSNDEALVIAARQKALNFPTGSDFSYTNTGYNLLALIVGRVSGKSFAEFSRERLFAPLGMSRTQWRDEYRKVVPGRATAYMPAAGGWALSMPFENVHGNGGLLTTVGDLLTWNAALESGRLGPDVTARLHQPGRLNDGREIEYARGLFIQKHRGAREITHNGGTAGYRAWLGRYPEHGLSVAMLCNAGNVDPDFQAHKVADLYLPKALPAAAVQRIGLGGGVASAAPPGPAVPAAEIARRTGVYVQQGSATIMHVVAEADRLRFRGGAFFEPAGPDAYKAGEMKVRFRPDGEMELTGPSGRSRLFDRGEPGEPSPEDLAGLAGTYVSDEADAGLVLSVKDGKLMIAPVDRPSVAAAATPLFKDGFMRQGGVVRVLRDRTGKVEGLRYQGGRVWDFRFRKVS